MTIHTERLQRALRWVVRLRAARAQARRPLPPAEGVTIKNNDMVDQGEPLDLAGGYTHVDTPAPHG